MIRRAAVVALASAILLLPGRSEPAAPPDRPPAGRTGPEPSGAGTSLAALRKGMTAAEVRAILGEPDGIKPFKSPDIGVYVWTYNRIVRGPERQVITGTREIPAVNPITGLPITQQEPIYAQEITYLHETIELLMQGDILLAWKRQVTEERRII